MEFVMQAIEPFPWRAGSPPRTTAANPQQQLDQIPNLADYEAMREIVTAWPSVIRRPSLRAPYGTLGMFLSDHDAQGPKEAFLLGTEFAHLHPLPDGSLHMVLPPEVHHAAIQRGWGVPHPMAGLPTISPQTILIFAPRDATERAVVVSLIRSAEAYARGHDYGVRGIARV
jgi:Luciferase